MHLLCTAQVMYKNSYDFVCVFGFRFCFCTNMVSMEIFHSEFNISDNGFIVDIYAQ